MESKSIKIVDEHGIDRVAHVICSIDINGSDYAVYWIERDSENDNIFVSKVLRNIDNTSNLVNIEDSMEKEKLSIIVKELVKKAVETENDNLGSDTVVLSSGETVKLSRILINKEQNINVQKTYITTVKKAVTKVASDFYELKEESKEEIMSDLGFAMPIFEEPSQPVVEPVSVSPEVPVLNIPQELVNEPVLEENVAPVVLPTEPVEPEKVNVPSFPEFKLDDEQFIPSPEVPIDNVVIETSDNKVVEPPVVPSPVIPSVEPEVSTLNVLPVDNVVPTVSEPVVSDVAPSSPTLVFDGSKEINLNEALGEVSSENSLPVADVEPIREFGIDPQIAPQETLNKPVEKVNDVVQNSSRSGFAHNKFFVVVVILLFLVSCLFLGYEAYRYFSII